MRAPALDAAWGKLEAPGGVAWVGAAMALLVAEAEAAEDPAAAADLLCDAAALASARADAAERAPALYEEAQVRAPGHAASAEGLALAAEARGDWRAVARWCEAGLDGGAAGPIRLRLLIRLIRSVQDHGVEATRSGLALLKEAIVLAPGDAGLEMRLALAGDDAVDSPEALDRKIGETGSLPHRARLLLLRAAQRRAAGDLDAARTDLVDALRADPTLAPARDALTQVLVQSADFAGLVEHLERSADALPEGAMRGRARYVAALYADGVLGAPDRAAALFGAAADDLRGDVAAARELARQGLGDAAALQAWRADPDPREAALGSWQLGRAAEREGDRTLAAEAYAAAAVGGLRVAGLAQRRLMTQGAAAELLEHLDPAEPLSALLAEQAGWEALGAGDAAAAQAHFAVAATGLGGDRVALAVGALGGTGPSVDAAHAWRASVGSSELEPRAMAVVAKGAGEPAAWIAAAYDQRDAQVALDAALAAPRGMKARLAAWAARRAAADGSPELEERAWRLALEDAPGSRLAHIGLGRLLAGQGRWAEVASLFDADPAPEARARAAALRVAHGSATPSDLERLRGADSRWGWAAASAAVQQGDVTLARQLLDGADDPFTLGYQAGLVPSVEAASAALSAGADAGMAWVLEALARPAGDAAAIARAVAGQGTSARLRGRLDGVASGADANEPFEAWTAARLAVQRADLEGAERHLAALAGRLGATADGWWVAQVAAEVRGWGGDAPAAAVAAAWERVIALHADTPRAWDALLELRSEEPTGRAATLVRAARQAQGDEASSLALWEAALLERHRDAELAAELNAQAVAAWPTGGVPQLSAWGGWIGPAPEGEARVSAAVALVGCVRSPALQAEFLSKAAEVCEQALERPADAARLSGLAAQRAPQSWALVETARGRLAAQRAWGPLCAVFERRLLAGPQAAERDELLRALAEAQLEGLRDREAARATWQRIVTHAPDDAQAHATLADLSFGLEDFPTAASHYELALELGLPDEEAGRLRMRVGRLRARHFKDVDGALRHLRQAETLGVNGAAEAAAETLLTHGRASDAVAAYERLAAEATDPVARSSARAGWVRALVVDGQRALAREKLVVFRADDPADPLLLALDGELGRPSEERDYKAVLDSLDLADGSDASDWGESLDLGPLGALDASASLAFEDDDLALEPTLGGEAPAELGDALAEVDALLARGVSDEVRDESAPPVPEAVPAAPAHDLDDELGGVGLGQPASQAGEGDRSEGGDHAAPPVDAAGEQAAPATGLVAPGAPERPVAAAFAEAADPPDLELPSLDGADEPQAVAALRPESAQAGAESAAEPEPESQGGGAGELDPDGSHLDEAVDDDDFELPSLPGGVAGPDVDMPSLDSLGGDLGFELPSLGDAGDAPSLEGPTGAADELDAAQPRADLAQEGLSLELPGSDEVAQPLASASAAAEAADGLALEEAEGLRPEPSGLEDVGPPPAASPAGAAGDGSPDDGAADLAESNQADAADRRPEGPTQDTAASADPADSAEALDAPWVDRPKRPSTGTLSMGVVALAKPNTPAALDLDGWDVDDDLAALSKDPAPTALDPHAPQPESASDAPISMGPLEDASWPSLPGLTPSSDGEAPALGAPLPATPSPAAEPPAPEPQPEPLEADAVFGGVAPVAPTTGSIPLVKVADPAPTPAVSLVAEGHDLEWLDPSVPPAQIPPTPPPLPAQDSWDELAIEEADSQVVGTEPPLPSVELEWAELDLAPASVEVTPGAEGSWSDLDDPFEGDLEADDAGPASWPADISGVEPLDLEAEDLGLETPGPALPPPPLPPPVVRPAKQSKSPSRADRAAEARIRIAREPLAPAGWLMLSEAETGDPAVSAWLTDVLAWLQGRVESSAAPGVPSEPVPERLRRAMVPDGVPPNLLLLLRSVGPSVAPAFGPVKGRDRHGRRVPDHEPLAALVRRMGRLLEVPPVQAVLNDARPYTVAAEAGEPSRLVLGTAVFDGSDPAGASFLVARTLIPLREGTLPATVLSDREFRAFLAALFDMLDASFPVRSRDQATMERIRGWLEPLLAVHQRLAWEPLAHAAVSGLGSRSAATVRLGLEQYSARLALALADGFGGAMEMLRLLDFDDRPRGQLGRADLEQFLADNDAARDLLVFAASPACLDARRWLARSTASR